MLIAEHQPDIRKLIRMALEFGPCGVHEATNGADGLRVCTRVRALPALQGPRVVLLSARGQLQDRAAGQRAGADDDLVEPFSPLQLVETIERLMPAS